MGKFNVLSEGSTNAKLAKSDQFDGAKFYNVILYLSPYTANSTDNNVCPYATAECIKACLNTAGRGAFSSVQNARVRKTDLLFNDRETFLKLLIEDLHKAQAEADKLGKELVIRLNGTSDLPWYEWLDFATFPRAIFYDYTKGVERYRDFLHGKLPQNYTLVFSFTPEHKAEALGFLASNGRVSVVFSGELPTDWHGFPVADGDAHDLIFIQPKGSVLGLKAKGKAKGMVRGGFIQIGKL